MMYSCLEQHESGDWWYHPGFTFDSAQAAEDKFAKAFWWDPQRPHRILEHEHPFPQDGSIYTTDFENFGFGGLITWTKSKGTLQI